MSTASRATAYYQGGITTDYGPVDTLLVVLPPDEDQDGDSSPTYMRRSSGQWAADDMATTNGWRRVTEWEPVPGEPFHRAQVERVPAPSPQAPADVSTNAEITVSAHALAPADLDALIAAVEDAAAPWKATVTVTRDE